MIAVNPSAQFELSLDIGVTGLVGTLAYAIVDGEGATVIGPTTAGITENDVDGTPTGNYTAVVAAAPAVPGQYQAIGSTDGTFAPDTTFSEDLLVTGDTQAVVVPPTPIEGGPTLGPCTAWCTGEDVALCRGDTTASDFALYDDVAVQASMLLYEVTGHQFSGVCTRTARPCRTGCGCWTSWIPAGVALPVYAFGYWGGAGWGWGDESGVYCGCQPLSRVKLSGYPVREIVEVKIDGAVLDELDVDGNPNYRLDGWRWLTRMASPGPPVVARRWPGCQNLALDDSEVGTFSVAYRYGIDPPPLGVQAAASLASELFNACDDGAECKLPSRVTRIVRQGVTYDRVAAAAAALREGASGLPLVDAFIAGYPMKGTRRPAVWSPDVPGFARTVGS